MSNHFNFVEEIPKISKKEKIIHLKGYMFDSLVYRFKDYQAKAFQVEVNDLKFQRNLPEIDARQIVKNRHERDLMRFIKILNEAIGEHD